MANRTVEQIVNASADALNESGNASRVALQELAKAYSGFGDQEREDSDRRHSGALRREEPR